MDDKIAALQNEIKALKIAALEKKLADLRTEGAPLDDARFAEVTQGLAELSGSGALAAPPAPAPPPPVRPPPPPPPPEIFEPFPSPALLGVDGQRSCVIFYAYDGIPIVETLLEVFEDEAEEYASCGCALVAVRRVNPGDSADVRKAKQYEKRFPSINFVSGLDSFAPELAAKSSTLGLQGLAGDWVRTLYYHPLVTLLEPNGGMRTVLSHKGLSAPNVLGQIMRNLHMAVPATSVSSSEKEANRQALYGENVEWSEKLKEDESLRQPTRYWFDGIFEKRDSRPLLAGVDAAALPEAIDRYLADGDEDGEEVFEEVVSADGVKAPSWYTKAKRTAERKQEEERLLWNGTAPSASAGPLPLGPSGARFAPLEQYSKKALAEANYNSKQLVSAFFREYGVDESVFGFLTGGEGDAVAASGGEGGEGEEQAPRSATTESALLRAEMLALGLSRSARGGEMNPRRLRLLREFEASVKELQSEGFGRGGDDRTKLNEFKDQIKESYASAPKEFLEEVSGIAHAHSTQPYHTPLTQPCLPPHRRGGRTCLTRRCRH